MPPNQPPVPNQFVPPANPPAPDPSLNFVPNPQPAPAPPTPAPAPTPDPTITQLQIDIAEIKTALGGITPQPGAPAPAPTPGGEQPKYFTQNYDDWGALEKDTRALVTDEIENKLKEREQAAQQATADAAQQEQQNQQQIDATLNQLRQAGYLPQVANQFDPNDAGKQAENELIGYAIYGLGTADLVKAAQELKFRHDSGFRFDHVNKQLVQMNQPGLDPNAGMFGNLPANPDQPQPGQIVQPQYPQAPPYPVGPQNPYMPQSYPPGFNAPVSSGNSFQGTQGGVPTLRNIRNNSYDGLVDQFNRTQ